MIISILLLICAMMLSSVAGYYSVVGLAAIFSASYWPVVLMASTLEICKLVAASWVYQYWNKINIVIKCYLISAICILMFITSLGIFGFLSKAHFDQGQSTSLLTLQIKQVDDQILQSNDASKRYNSELEQLDKSINIQLDANKATQALSARNRQNELRSQLKTNLDKERETVDKLTVQKTELEKQITVSEQHIGPIKYIAELISTDKTIDVDKAVRYMILLLVIVFDPLAVVMVISANIGLSNLTKTEKKVAEEKIEPEPIEVPTPKVVLPLEPTVQNTISENTTISVNEHSIRITEKPTQSDSINNETINEPINNSLTTDDIEDQAINSTKQTYIPNK